MFFIEDGRGLYEFILKFVVCNFLLLMIGILGCFVYDIFNVFLIIEFKWLGVVLEFWFFLLLDVVFKFEEGLGIVIGVFLLFCWEVLVVVREFFGLLEIVFFIVFMIKFGVLRVLSIFIDFFCIVICWGVLLRLFLILEIFLLNLLKFVKKYVSVLVDILFDIIRWRKVLFFLFIVNNIFFFF